MPLVLLAGSNRAVTGTRAEALRRAGYDVVEASDRAGIHRVIASAVPSALLIDLPLADASHDEVATLLSSSTIPVLLSGPPEAEVVAQAPNLFVAQPCETETWLEAVRALLSNPWPDLRLDETTGILTWRSRDVRLTPIETRLVGVLLRAGGDVVSADSLVRDVWGYDAEAATADLVRAHVYQLRQRLARASFPSLIETLPRRGYRIALDSS